MIGGLIQAAGHGAAVLAGQIGQNALVRYTPSVPGVPPAVNDVGKDVLGIVLGGMLAYKVSPKFAPFFVAGQVAAFGARVLRSLNISPVSGLLGEYDPIHFGVYVRGTTGSRSSTVLVGGDGGTKNLPASGAANVRTLAGVGVYSPGGMTMPSLY